jgi:eukaryotic-like serine/threonine-protein kinase
MRDLELRHQPSAPPELQLVSRYEFKRALGEGGMGSVWVAFDAHLKREVAIKFLHADRAASEAEKARFEREAECLSKLSHPNVVRVMTFGFDANGAACLVMELLGGQSLRVLFDTVLAKTQKPFAAPRAVTLVLQACEGLIAVHEAGIVHRDLKPENMIVSTAGEGRETVKLIDFGIAKLSAPFESDALMTKPGSLVGSLYYLSPEQARGDTSIDGRTDIYSLGVVLYELLSGIRPGGDATVGEVLARIVATDRTPLDRLGLGIPEGLSDVVARALSRDRDQRFRTAAEFADALRPFVPERLRAKVTVDAPAERPLPGNSDAQPAPATHEWALEPTVDAPAIAMGPVLPVALAETQAAEADSRVGAAATGTSPLRRRVVIAALGACVALFGWLAWRGLASPASSDAPPSRDPTRPSSVSEARAASTVEPSPSPAPSVASSIPESKPAADASAYPEPSPASRVRATARTPRAGRDAAAPAPKPSFHPHTKAPVLVQEPKDAGTTVPWAL